MLEVAKFRERLEFALSETSGIIVPNGAEAEAFYESLRAALRSSACEPFLVKATVTGEDFPERLRGTAIEAYALAASGGYWLAYRPESDEFYCFWGESASELGAHLQSGPPLFLWWQ